MPGETPTVEERIAQGLKEHPARKGMRFNIFVTAVEVGGSIGLFRLPLGGLVPHPGRSIGRSFAKKGKARGATASAVPLAG